jgi:hypothetical protein
MANDINDQIIQKIEENDPNYKIIDLKNVENCFEKYFLEKILEKLNINCYIEKIIWPSNDTQITIEIVQKIENILNNRFQRIIQKIEKNDPNYKVVDFSNIDNEIRDLNQLLDQVNKNCYVGNIIWPYNNRPNNEKVQQIENKIKENNWKFERFPNYFVHLLFCRHIYGVSSEYIDKTVSFNDEYLSRYNGSLKDWKIKKIRESNLDDYLGAIYINDKTHQLVLVHKGNINFGHVHNDIHNDIERIFNEKKVPKQVECLELIKSAIEISKKGTIYNVSITGFSYGVIKVYFLLYPGN